MEWYRQHSGVVRVLAGLVPLVVSAGLNLLVAVVPNSAAALVLVLVVVGSAATGNRLAGALAAVSSALGFDFFLTQPFFQLRIHNAQDIELAGLLLMVGLAVSELASWGIRQSARANEQGGFVQGALQSANLAAGSIDDAEALERVAKLIGKVLGIEAVSFEYGEHDAAASVIQRDGSMKCQGKALDVALTGLPRSPCGYAAIPVARHGAQVGYFRIGTPARDVRPTREQLEVAVLLAGQWALRVEPPQPKTRHGGPGRPTASPARVLP